MLNNICCIDKKSIDIIDKTIKIIHNDLSCNNAVDAELSKSINETNISKICEEELTKENKFCYDDCRYEICSINNIECNLNNDNIKEIKISYDNNDEMNEYNINNKLQDEIKEYANRINCKDFYGKGTINDYSKLFEVVSNMANEYKQIDFNFEVDGFIEFSNTADQLINIFESFSKKLQNIK